VRRLFWVFLFPLLAVPQAVPARFHHVHAKALDPSEDMGVYARTFSGVSVILQGLGVGVRLGPSYVLFDRVDDDPPRGPVILNENKVYWQSDNPAALRKWFSDVLGIKLDENLVVILSPGAALPASGRVVDHLAFSYPDLAAALARLEKLGVKSVERAPVSAFVQGPEGQRVEIVEDADLGTAKYWCPMDPKVRSAEPGKCPICGMVLVPLDPGEYVEYPIQVDVRPAALKAGQQGTLRFVIRDPRNGQPVTSYELVHEKLFHLFVVSYDLSVFAHVHPEPQKDGSFILEWNFPKPGPYQLYADFFPSGGTPQVVQKTFVTTGYSGTLTGAKTRLQPETRLEKAEQGTLVRLQNAKFLTGRKQNLDFTLLDERTGQPVKDLQPYLGAWGHMLILSEDLGDYLHAHANGPGQEYEAVFPRPGNYRVWVQFQRHGRVNTVAFNVSASRLR